LQGVNIAPALHPESISQYKKQLSVGFEGHRNSSTRGLGGENCVNRVGGTGGKFCGLGGGSRNRNL